MSWESASYTLEEFVRDHPLEVAAFIEKERKRGADAVDGKWHCKILGCSSLVSNKYRGLCWNCNDEALLDKELEKTIQAAIKARASANFRIRWQVDAAVRELERNENKVVKPVKRARYTGPPRKGYVYRLKNNTGKLLYVGKTYNVHRRLLNSATSHACTKSWWAEVAEVDVAVYSTEASALLAEALIIHRENPVYNIDRPRPKITRLPPYLHRYVGRR